MVAQTEQSNSGITNWLSGSALCFAHVRLEGCFGRGSAAYPLPRISYSRGMVSSRSTPSGGDPRTRHERRSKHVVCKRNASRRCHLGAYSLKYRVRLRNSPRRCYRPGEIYGFLEVVGDEPGLPERGFVCRHVRVTCRRCKSGVIYSVPTSHLRRARKYSGACGCARRENAQRLHLTRTKL